MILYALSCLLFLGIQLWTRLEGSAGRSWPVGRQLIITVISIFFWFIWSSRTLFLEVFLLA